MCSKINIPHSNMFMQSKSQKHRYSPISKDRERVFFFMIQLVLITSPILGSRNAPLS